MLVYTLYYAHAGEQIERIPSKDSLYWTMLGWLILARTATSFRDSCLSLLGICQRKAKENVKEQDSENRITLTETCEVCAVLFLRTYSRYANLLDDILAFILFWFDKDSFSKWPFPNFLHLFVFVHVTGRTRSSCWVYKKHHPMSWLNPLLLPSIIVIICLSVNAHDC